MKRDYAEIDKRLNGYASKTIADGEGYNWWWNGDSVLALAIASACRHVRKDGCHVLDKVERAELKKLERYFYDYGTSDCHCELTSAEMDWLYAEAFHLLKGWFPRLWA